MSDFDPKRGQSYSPTYGNSMRVTAITEVKRRNTGLRVRGLIDSGMWRYRGGNSGYGQTNYGQPGYGSANAYQMGDLKFRCTVDGRGAVTDLKVERNYDYRR